MARDSKKEHRLREIERLKNNSNHIQSLQKKKTEKRRPSKNDWVSLYGGI